MKSKSPRNMFEVSNVISKNKIVGLWRLLRGYRIAYLVATITLAVASLSKTVTYLLLQYLIDDILGKGIYPPIVSTVRNAIILIALGFIGLAFLEGAFSFISGRMTALTAEGIARRLRDYLFDHIQRLTFTYHDKTQTGELIQRATSDVDALRRFFSDQAIGVGRVVVIFVINFIAIWRLHQTLAIVSIAIIPIIIFVSGFFYKRITQRYEAYQEQDAKVSTTLQENFSGVRVVKAFARQAFEIEKFDKDNYEKLKRGKALVLTHTFYWPFSDILAGSQMVGGMIFAAWLAIQGQITVGIFVAYMGLVGWLIWPIRNLGRLIVQTSTGLVSFGRVIDIVREEKEPLKEGKFIPQKGIEGNLVYKNVGFHYEEGVPTLEDITFQCKAGQVVALIGYTGSGKSSLVNLLLRFYEYTSGSLTLDGIELNQYPRKFLRDQIGIVEQEPFLFSRTIEENITYGVGRDVKRDEIENAAKAAAIHDVILSFPDGYNTLVGEKGVTLSGGQKQRVAIARTILKNPKILILDDSTSSVDPETEGLIRNALEKLMETRTTFIIAHRIQSVMNADIILVLDRGKIIEKGTHKELMAINGVYREIYDIQTRIEIELEKELSQVL